MIKWWIAFSLSLLIASACSSPAPVVDRQIAEPQAFVEPPAFSVDRIDLRTFLEGERQIGNRCCTHSVNVVPSDRFPDTPSPRTPDQALRFELRYDDPDVPFTSKRAEITLDGVVDDLGVIGGPSEWYGFSVFLPHDHQPDPAAEIIAQWHATPDNGEVFRSPVLALMSWNGHWQIVSRHSDSPIQRSNDAPEQRLWQERYDRGSWTDFIFQTRWDWRASGEGLVNAWMKTSTETGWRPVLSHRGPIGYRDDRNIYFKAGIYKWPWEDCQTGDSVLNCSGSGSPSPSTVKRRVVYLDGIRALSGDHIDFKDFAAIRR